jgi:hypothetical protein
MSAVQLPESAKARCSAAVHPSQPALLSARERVGPTERQRVAAIAVLRPRRSPASALPARARQAATPALPAES